MRIRASKVIAGKPVGEYQAVDAKRQTPVVETQGLAARVVRAIDLADAQGRGCSGCKAVRKVARKMVTRLAGGQAS